MLGFFRGVFGFEPYQDTTDIVQIILPADRYNLLIDRLLWGLENSLEDGGFITVTRKAYQARVVGVYPTPDEFKEFEHVHFSKIPKSKWFIELRKYLIKKGERIGFEYHTHAMLVDYPQTEHEEWKTASRVGRNSPLINDPLIDGDSYYRRSILGDLILERTKEGAICLHGYTPVGEPYKEIKNGEIRMRETHSLIILIPELNLEYCLPL